ncbi:hypothetical protein Pcinc_003704 [Petrolisthes cinctipes]|uniref:Uncharacterized protein n=1 Tax=Petrolisthes cinctipes TaxID=88211 RepID=A0AAE1GIL9_PETCI|nr:hypothetical protein Pcinc_003704 [Petrolisthes cinctipes]
MPILLEAWTIVKQWLLTSRVTPLLPPRLVQLPGGGAQLAACLRSSVVELLPGPTPKSLLPPRKLQVAPPTLNLDNTSKMITCSDNRTLTKQSLKA